MPPPLDGIRVVDLSRVLAGPYCTMMLADLGADVVKVERPGDGDETRSWGPPYAGDEAAYFLAVNRGKRSIAVDLKQPEGRDLVLDLCTGADVVLENFRAGAAARLGLDAASVQGRNPRVVYCSITGFGRRGSRDRPGYDFVVQAESGLMAVTGEEPTRFGNAHPSIAPYQPFRASDGWVAVAAANDGLFARLCSGIGRPDLAEDERFRTNAARVLNRAALLPLLEGVFATRSADEWVAALDEAGVPAGKIRGVLEALRAAEPATMRVTHPSVGELELVAPPFAFDSPLPSPGAPPLLGQHTCEVLTELGVDKARIAELEARGVVAQSVRRPR
jgi:crotonobetainyl-CoA:carnitine CoA-transferase CaiB-like acyl-CoA transferase